MFLPNLQVSWQSRQYFRIYGGEGLLKPPPPPPPQAQELQKTPRRNRVKNNPSISQFPRSLSHVLNSCSFLTENSEGSLFLKNELGYIIIGITLSRPISKVNHKTAHLSFPLSSSIDIYFLNFSQMLICVKFVCVLLENLANSRHSKR